MVGRRWVAAVVWIESLEGLDVSYSGSIFFRFAYTVFEDAT